MNTPAENLRGDRILTSVVTHLRAEKARLAADYQYDAACAVSDAIKTIWSVHLQVRADVLNMPRDRMPIVCWPECY